MKKSFSDYVGSDVIGRVPNPTISSAPTSNKRLSLPTAGIVSAAVSSKTGFAEWHASTGGWVTYAQDFLEVWSGGGGGHKCWYPRWYEQRKGNQAGKVERGRS